MTRKQFERYIVLLQCDIDRIANADDRLSNSTIYTLEAIARQAEEMATKLKRSKVAE